MDTKIRVSMRGVSEQAFGSRCADGLYRDFVTHPAATQAIKLLFFFFTDERESAIPNGKFYWATASARGIASARELQG